MKLKNGLSLNIECLDDTGCNNGNYPEYTITNNKGEIVKSGQTCRCGRGCSGTDCVYDAWGYHDTEIEEFREE